MLAHRRLAILDVSTAASQPLVDPCSGHVIVFNGEIYNFKDLRKELELRGHTFQSSGDTAVLARTLYVHGVDAVGKLRGMFAFGRWDEADRQLLLARDPLGIKPLYFARNPNPSGDWSLAFASEVRTILASGLLENPKVDTTAVASVLWNGYVVGPGTIVEGIEMLLPGELMLLDGGGRQIAREQFWTMPAGDNKTVDTSDVREALHESVRLHLISDVPLGVFFSGGIDSSAVANLAQAASQQRVSTFTLAFEEDSLNEGQIAQRIAKAIGTEHHQVVLSQQRFVSSLDTALDSLDQPTFDGLNSYYMAKSFREAGFTVALVGTGGDELFGGYASFRYLPRLRRFASRMRWIPQAAKRAAARAVATVVQGFPSASAVAPQTRWAKLPFMLDLADDHVALCQLAYALFLPDFYAKLLTKSKPAANGHITSGLPQPMLQRLQNETRGHSALSAISVMELRCFLGERLLRDSDAASMASSVELRLPLVDHALVESVSRLPDNQRYYPLGRKTVLREFGLADLDPALFNRPKSGFVLPYDTWIRKNLGRVMDETMRDETQAATIGLDGRAVSRLWNAYQDGAPGIYWSRVWAIYVLIRWCHQRGVLL
jgi:asparagine synthase (glutamine-hydrolysing)